MTRQPLVSHRFCWMFMTAFALGIVLGHVFSYFKLNLGLDNAGLGAAIGTIVGLVLGYFIGKRIEDKENKE